MADEVGSVFAGRTEVLAHAPEQFSKMVQGGTNMRANARKDEEGEDEKKDEKRHHGAPPIGIFGSVVMTAGSTNVNDRTPAAFKAEAVCEAIPSQNDA